MGVGNCGPGTPLLLVFPMPQAKTKYQRNQEIANLRLDAKTRFLAAAKDPNRKEDISTLIQASGLSKSAAYRYLAGGLTKAESNKSKAWLSPEEEEAQVDELLALAARGFGEVRKQIAQRIEDYIRIRDNNPHFQIGKNYVYNFCQRHHNRLQMYWTTSLTTIRCKAMSPEILEHWWKLLADWFTKFGIKTAKQIFGADEVGFIFGHQHKLCVVGPKGIRNQYQQTDPSRESCTLLMLTCADGRAWPPLVIFKASEVLPYWGLQNPLNASL